MSGIIESFGHWVDRTAPKHPDRVRRVLSAAFRAYLAGITIAPDRRRAPSRNAAERATTGMMIRAFAHPEQAVLTSMFLPCEILQAFDLNPFCAEMFAAHLNGAYAAGPFVQKAQQVGIAQTYCSYHKILMGALIDGVMPAVRCVVNCSLACDANNLTFRAASRIMDRPQYYIDVPYAKNDAAVQYVAEQLKGLVPFLEQAVGRPFDQEKFAAAIAASRRTLHNMHETIPYRATRYLSGDLTSQLYEALLVHNGRGRSDALAFSRRLLEDYRQARPITGKKILWMHTNPYWQQPVAKYFNEREAVSVVATDLSYDMWAAVPEEPDPYRFMAATLVYDHYNGPVQDRIKAALAMAGRLKADGVVLFCHWGCKETCGASGLIKKALEQAGYPCLVLNGDGADRGNVSDGPMETRVQAFLELLEGQS